MQKLKINHLSETGLLEAEIPALKKIAESLPPNWLAYSNLEFRDKSFGNREIDLLLVTEHTILIVELKNWNGRLESDGSLWSLNGRNRGKSPVLITNDKAKKLKTLILERERHNLTGNIYVNPIVVLCGSAGPENLTKSDRDFTVTLEDFCAISSPAKFRSLFPATKPRKSPLCKEKELFNRLFSLKYFDPRKYRYYDYVPSGPSFFSHKRGLYQEFFAKHDNITGYRALLRTWDLAQLPESFSSEKQWRSITSRESEVVGYIRQNLSQEFVKESILTPLGHTPTDEFSKSFFELYELPSDCDLLESFVNKNTKTLTHRDRIGLATRVLYTFNTLHKANIAHRDISETSLWTGHNLSIMISRWASAAVPESQTVGQVREFLHSGRSLAPEDGYGLPSDQFRRDVFLLGRVLFFILTGDQPPQEDGIAQFQQESLASSFRSANDIDSEQVSRVVEKALALEPNNRYQNAIDLFESFQYAAQTEDVSLELYKGELADFRTDVNPYIDFPAEEHIQNSPILLYRAVIASETYFVKIWPSLQPSDTEPERNFNLLEFLTACSTLKRTRQNSVHPIVTFGLSQLGLFLVTKKVPGRDLSSVARDTSLTDLDRVKICIAVLEAVVRLHEISVTHGDLKPENILVQSDSLEETSVFLIDIPDIDIDGHLRHSPAFSHQRLSDHSQFEKDRFAALVTIVTLLGGTTRYTAESALVEIDNIVFEDIEEEINKRISALNAVKSLDPTVAILKDTEKALSQPTIPHLNIALKGLTTRRPLHPDGEIYSILCRASRENTLPTWIPFEADRFFDVTLLGVDGSLKLIWDSATSSIVTGRLDENTLEHLHKHARASLRAFVVLNPAPHSDFNELDPLLQSKLTEVIPQRRTQRSSSPELATDPPETADSERIRSLDHQPTLDLAKLWRTLIESESSVLPEVEISDEPEFPRSSGSACSFTYENVNGFPLEFGEGEIVLAHLVRTGNDHISIGRLDQQHSSASTMVIRLDRPSDLALGDHIRLESLQSKASYDKRRTAVEKMIRGETAFPNLFDWLSGKRLEAEKLSIAREVWLNLIPKGVDLNRAQLEAINLALTTSPISLVQGPPGTGKTLYISALIYILNSIESGNILVTSQSHEAVNNCIEKLIGFYEATPDDLDIVRVGPLAMCSDTVARFHIDHLQERYRRAFESDIRYRIENSAAQLGLKGQFVSQYVRLYLEINPLLTQWALLKENTDRDWEKRSQHVAESLMKSAQARANRISKKLAFPEVNDFESILDLLKRQLIEIHEISNRYAVSKLDSLIHIASEWRDALSSSHGNFAEFLTRTKRIVAGTCVGIGRKELNITKQHFSWVIVDEAARCTSGELAMPSAVGERIVYVGDHRQLPPMNTLDVIRSALDSLDGIVTQDELRTSDFQRLAKNPYGQAYSTLLDTQYRMAPAIGNMVSDIFYGGQLVTEKSQMLLPTSASNILGIGDVVWVDTSPLGSESREQNEIDAKGRKTPSRVNSAEIREILSILENFSSDEALVAALRSFAETHHAPPIGVICAYAGQKRELIRRFAQRPLSNEFRTLVKIDTVDSYQGKENLIIIQSLVRNNAKGEQGFLSEPERVNVAISRAMEKLFIIGSATMWYSRNTPLGQVFGYIESKSHLDARYAVIDACNKPW